MRRHDSVKLTKEGLFGDYYDKKIDDRISEGIHARGQKKGEFFWKNMNSPFAIEGKVTLKDLILVMADMDSDDLHALSTIADANLAPYLIEFAKNPDPLPDNDKYGKLTSIEVYKVMDFSNWSTCDDLFDMEMYTSAHGIGEIWSDSMKEVEAGRTKLEDVKDCNCYAIEFTPWQKMLDLPITIKDHFRTSEVIWKRVKPKEWKIGVLGSKRKFSMGKMDREIVNRSKLADGRKVRTELTLKEFFHGLFNELCFFGSPGRRDAESGILDSRVKDVEKQLAKEKKKKKKK